MGSKGIDKGLAGKVKWCFKIKEGLEIVEPNENLSESYLKEAKSSLARAEKDFQDGDLLWATVVIYYAEYYMKFGKEEEVEEILKEAKEFVSMFDEMVINLGEEDVNSYREKIIEIKT